MMMTTHVITVASELLVVVSSGAAALLQLLLFRAWLNGRYPQQAKSLAPLIEELRVVQQQHNALVATTRRGDFARLVLCLHELDGKLDGLCNDLKILPHFVRAAKERAKKQHYQTSSRPVRTLDEVIAFLFWFTAIPAFIGGLLWIVTGIGGLVWLVCS